MSVYSRLLDAYQRQDAIVRGRVEAYIRAQWPKDSWRSDDIDQFVRVVVPMVRQGQLQIARLTDAHLRQVDQLVFGINKAKATALTERNVTGSAVRSGVDPEAVYQRAGVTVYTALSAGKPLESAVAEGLRRALVLAATDLQLSKTHAASMRFESDRSVSGFQRVLTGAESCSLCSIASGHTYYRSDLLPIHGGCDCGVVPVRGGSNYASTVNAARVGTSQAETDNRFGADEVQLDTLSDAEAERRKVTVHQHGEIGPVLTIAGQHFTGPRGIPAT